MEEGDFTVCGFGYYESQEFLMRRLLSLFRSSDQHTTCTDFDCVDQLPNLQVPQSDSNTMMMMLMGWFAVAIALFYLRPASLQNRNNSKPSGSGSNPDGPPPGAPPAVN